MLNSPVRSSGSDPFLSDAESIHVATWTEEDAYEPLLINQKRGKHSQILSYNVVVKKLTYEGRDLKGLTVNIYQKPQALISYLIDTSFSREGDWVLDLFSGSGKLSHITYEIIYQVLLYVLSFIILLF